MACTRLPPPSRARLAARQRWAEEQGPLPLIQGKLGAHHPAVYARPQTPSLIPLKALTMNIAMPMSWARTAQWCAPGSCRRRRCQQARRPRRRAGWPTGGCCGPASRSPAAACPLPPRRRQVNTQHEEGTLRSCKPPFVSRLLPASQAPSEASVQYKRMPRYCKRPPAAACPLPPRQRQRRALVWL